MPEKKELFEKLEADIAKEKEILSEMNYLFNEMQLATLAEEKELFLSQISTLQINLKKTNKDVLDVLDRIVLIKPLIKKEEIKKEKPKKKPKKFFLIKPKLPKGLETTSLERTVIKRVVKEEEEVAISSYETKGKYVTLANKFFSEKARKLVKNDIFKNIIGDLLKTNLNFTPQGYIATILLTTAISFIAGFLIFLIALIFKVEAFPSIIINSNILLRFVQVFWIIFLIPVLTFIFLYLYPSLERKSIESKINQELPFAAIHMSAISGAMVEPSKIFSIIISTKEYPYLERELTKLINLLNVQGYDLVNALRTCAFKSPSLKLADLFNGLSVTIASGGALSNFFDKRAQSLLFEYRLEREKQIKSSETFMDIYISVVIAAPMILMLLLMIMKISGLGITMSSTMISVMIILGISIINVFFITFLYLKRPAGGGE